MFSFCSQASNCFCVQSNCCYIVCNRLSVNFNLLCSAYQAITLCYYVSTCFDTARSCEVTSFYVNGQSTATRFTIVCINHGFAIYAVYIQATFACAFDFQTFFGYIYTGFIISYADLFSFFLQASDCFCICFYACCGCFQAYSFVAFTCEYITFNCYVSTNIQAAFEHHVTGCNVKLHGVFVAIVGEQHSFVAYAIYVHAVFASTHDFQTFFSYADFGFTISYADLFSFFLQASDCFCISSDSFTQFSICVNTFTSFRQNIICNFYNAICILLNGTL